MTAPFASAIAAARPAPTTIFRDGLCVLLALFCLWQLMTVDVIVWITNDSSSYLHHAFNFSERGVVNAGYRTAGYPAFLRVAYELTAILPVDPLFLAVFLQRALLGIALLLSIFVLRLWSVPLVVLLANPAMMAFTNLVGPEALLVSLSLFFALGTLTAYRLLLEGRAGGAPFTVIFAFMCALYVFMCTIKILIAPIGLLLAAIWFQSVGAPVRPILKNVRRNLTLLATRRTTLTLGAACLLLASFLAAAAFENRMEFGVTTIAANMDRGRYWGAYTLTFRDPENRANPALKKFHAHGSPYNFIHRIECAGKFAAPDCKKLSADERAARFQRQIKKMFKASGMHPSAVQFHGVIAAFGGGRLNDLAGSIARVGDEAAAPGGPAPTAFVNNVEVRRAGLELFLTRFNRGRVPASIDGLGVPKFLDYNPHTLQPWLAAAVLAASFIAILNPRRRLFAAAALAAFLVFAIAIALSFLDNWRYVLPPWVVFAATSLGAAQLTLREGKADPTEAVSN